MRLSDIETIVLQLIKYDSYSKLSASVVAGKMADFAILHQCVNLAREEIKSKCSMPNLMRVGTVIPTVASQTAYSMASDFDIPVKMFYLTSDNSIKELGQLYVENIGNLVLGASTGTPSSYIVLGTSANLIQVYLSPIPAIAGESLLPVYKPVLTELSTSTDEDIIMRKYPKAVIDFASAFAFQMIKADQTQYDKYYAYGLNHCKTINLRESSFDPNTKLTVDSLLSLRRQGRRTI